MLVHISKLTTWFKIQIQGVEAPNQNDYENQKEQIIFTVSFSFTYQS